MASANVVNVTDASFKKEVLESDIPVVLDFTAVWCGPCKAIAPLLDQVADEKKGQIKVCKIDIDQIERMQDEMADLMDIGNEIQESISRAYDVPEDVDEAELDAELEALGEESMFETSVGEDAVPSFLQDEVAPPTFIDEPPEAGKVKEAAGGVG